MNVIAATRRNRRYGLFEADYLCFVLRLADRIGNEAAQERGGFPTVDVDEADDYIEWLGQFSIDQDEISMDFKSLPIDDRDASLPEFLPTVLVDFDERTFYCAHPERYYLNYGAYLSAGWTYAEMEDVATLLPTQHQYWQSWGV